MMLQLQEVHHSLELEDSHPELVDILVGAGHNHLEPVDSRLGLEDSHPELEDSHPELEDSRLEPAGSHPVVLGDIHLQLGDSHQEQQNNLLEPVDNHLVGADSLQVEGNHPELVDILALEIHRQVVDRDQTVVDNLGLDIEEDIHRLVAEGSHLEHRMEDSSF